MADPVWGMLQKSGVDSSTIETAVASMIAAHNADPTAHLGVGQSLQAHKNSDVIDHIASSIVPDKMNSSNRFTSIPVNGASDIYTENATSLQVGLLAVLHSNSPISGVSYAHVLNMALTDFGPATGDVIFDFIFYPSSSSGTAQGSFNVGFARVDMKAGYYRLGYFDGTWHYTTWVTSSSNTFKWRIFFSSTDHYLYFLLDGAGVYSVSYSTLTLDPSDYLIDVILNRGTSTWSSLYFGDILMGLGV